MSSEDIESFRQPWESDEHWFLRKKFLTCHWDKFSLDRLLCLAQVFVNVEFLGCTYSTGVMKYISELSKHDDIVKSIQTVRKIRSE